MVSKHRSLATVVIGGALYLAGCASVSPLTAQGMTVTPNDIATTTPAGLTKAIVVEDARSAASSNEIDDATFKDALVGSLERTELLGDAARARYKVTATILEVDQPHFLWFWAPVVTVTSKIRYRVVDAKTGAVVFDEEIVATDKAQVRDALPGDKRAGIATERSARKSIATLIEKLKAKRLG